MTGYLAELRRLVGSRPLIVVGACVLLLDDQDRLLLQLRADNGAWGLTGGAMEPGETFEQTARREAYEELGLTCGPLELLGVYAGQGFYYRYPNGDEIHNVLAAYLCGEFTGDLRLQADEVTRVGWFGLDALPSPLCGPDTPVIEDLRRRAAKDARRPG